MRARSIGGNHDCMRVAFILWRQLTASDHMLFADSLYCQIYNKGSIVWRGGNKNMEWNINDLDAEIRGLKARLNNSGPEGNLP